MASSRREWHVARALGVLRALLPSFVADAVWPETCRDHLHSDRGRRKLHATSYLDGLRGIASFIVCVCHYTEKRHVYLLPSYGLGPDGEAGGGGSGGSGGDAASSFLQLPYLRVLYSGRPMVHIFFVISGFVLAYRPLRLLHGQPARPETSYAALASSVFRRPIRLFLPCAVSTLGVAVLCQTGQLYAADATWAGQLRSWAGVYAGHIVWPWSWDTDLRPGYDIHLWTISIEFAHAMLLFVVLLGLSRLRTGLRRSANALLAAYCLACGKWAAFEFLAGLFLAERHVLRAAVPTPPPPPPPAWQRVLDHHRLAPAACRRLTAAGHVTFVAFHAAVLGACLFVAGWPNDNADQTPGVRTLLARTPSWFLRHANQEPPALQDPRLAILAQKFWFSIAAVCTVWSCGELERVRWLFERPLAQYCGRISYALYLVHGPALDYFQDVIVGRTAVAAVTAAEEGGGAPMPPSGGAGIKGLIGVETAAQRTLTWFVGLVALGAVFVWLADLFWRLVDEPIVQFARALEKLCLRAETPGSDPRASKEEELEPDREEDREGREDERLVLAR